MSIYDAWKNSVSEDEIKKAEKAAAEAKENEFQEVPAGEYDVVLNKLELKDSSFDDSKQIWINLKVIEGEYKGSTINYNGVFRDNFSKGFNPTSKLLAALSEEPEAEPIIQTVLRIEEYDAVEDLLADIKEAADGLGYSIKYDVKYSGKNANNNNQPYKNIYISVEDTFEV
mgnify:FL=1